MAAKYQCWEKSVIGTRTGTFASEHYTLDTAMESAKKLSRGTKTKQVWNPNKNPNAANPWQSGGYDDVEVPNYYAVIERGDRASTTRCWAIGGVIFDAKQCKRCNNTGEDQNTYGEVCPSCKGSSYQPRI